MTGKKNTVQRSLILQAVKALNIHASAEQVFEYVVKSHPSISKATVYRNLSQMAASGELLNIGDFYGAAHYDHNCHEHYHFICENCKRIFDIEGDFSDIFGRVNGKDGLHIKNFNLSFNGLCRACKVKSW